MLFVYQALVLDGDRDLNVMTVAPNRHMAANNIIMTYPGANVLLIKRVEVEDEVE